METTDQELIHSYITGDERAFQTLVIRYTKLIYNFVVRFGITSEAEDVTQEIFLKAWKYIRKFNADKASFKTWLFTIARNTITDFLRKKKAVVFSDMESDDADNNFAGTLEDTALLPDNLLDKKMDAEEIATLLSTLPTDYKTVILLYYQEDMTFEEIGTVLGKSINTVKSQHRRGLEKLRKMLENKSI